VVRTRRDGKLILIRRARGFVPEAVALGGVQADEPGVALGSDLKLAAAFVVSDKAYLTPYLGELTNRETFDHAWRTLTHWRAWLGVTPRWIAHDTHPDALSRRLAEQLAAEWQAQCIPVWHHPAHLAAVIAETTPETAGPWVGWSLDGFGWGEGGEAWGGNCCNLTRADSGGGSTIFRCFRCREGIGPHESRGGLRLRCWRAQRGRKPCCTDGGHGAPRMRRRLVSVGRNLPRSNDCGAGSVRAPTGRSGPRRA